MQDTVQLRRGVAVSHARSANVLASIDVTQVDNNRHHGLKRSLKQGGIRTNKGILPPCHYVAYGGPSNRMERSLVTL